jgi:hypothetical protein
LEKRGIFGSSRFFCAVLGSGYVKCDSLTWHVSVFVVISLQVRQFADICLFSTAQYKCTVAEAESE